VYGLRGVWMWSGVVWCGVVVVVVVDLGYGVQTGGVVWCSWLVGRVGGCVYGQVAG